MIYMCTYYNLYHVNNMKTGGYNIDDYVILLKNLSLSITSIIKVF